MQTGSHASGSITQPKASLIIKTVMAFKYFVAPALLLLTGVSRFCLFLLPLKRQTAGIAVTVMLK